MSRRSGTEQSTANTSPNTRGRISATSQDSRATGGRSARPHTILCRSNSLSASAPSIFQTSRPLNRKRNAHSPQPIVSPQRHRLPQPRNSRLQRLQASIKRTAVDGANGRIERDDFLGQLLGLFDTVRSQRRVRGDLGGRGHVGEVFARGRVQGPIDAELERRVECVLVRCAGKEEWWVGLRCCSWDSMRLPFSERSPGSQGLIATYSCDRATRGDHTVLYEDVVIGREDLLTPCLVR